MNKFKNRLNELMKENNYNEKDIANLINYKNLSTIYTWTDGTYTPKLDNMLKLSNLFKCSIEYLIGRTDDYEEIPPKECPPFYERLINVLETQGLKKTHLRNKRIISRGLAESIFSRHSSPHMDNVIKIADYLKVSIDELVGRV